MSSSSSRPLVKDRDQFQWDQFAETRHERLKPILHMLRDAIFDVLVNLFSLVFFHDAEVSTPRLQPDGMELPETFFRRNKRFVDYTHNISLRHETAMATDFKSDRVNFFLKIIL